MSLPSALSDGDTPREANPVEVALLGHDLRAAMSDIIGGLRLIDQSRLDEATRLQLGRVQSASEVLARLLEDGLAQMVGEVDLPTRGPSHVHLVRFIGELSSRWRGRAQEKGLTFTVTAADDLPTVLTLDRLALERILSNVLSNAIKYTDVGQVELAVRMRDDGALLWTVRDEGPGFSPSALEQLFQYRSRPEDAHKTGQGLGLHITKDMADRLGAEIKVRNLPGTGAEVTFALPAGAYGVRQALDQSVELPDLSGLHVLLADDNATNQAIFGHMLTALGADFTVASDGIVALERLGDSRFDLALIDIEMPRLSGIDVIRAMRAGPAEMARLPVLAVTAYVLRANREAIYAAGADGILAKPIGGIDAFGQAITAVMTKSELSPATAVDMLDSPQLIDRARLDHLLEIAGPEGARELLRRLAEDLGSVERGLVTGLAGPDFVQVRSHTHVLIALAGAVGSDMLRAQAETMNAAAHRRDHATLKAMGADSMRQLDLLIHLVSDELSARGGAG